MGVENEVERRRERAVSKADVWAVTQEIGAFACVEVSLSSPKAAAEAECVFTRVALAALGLCDPFAPLRDAAADRSTSTAAHASRSWHVPSAELCSRLLANAGLEAKKNGPQPDAGGGSCLLQ